MNKLDITLLKKICETPGTSGFENAIRNEVIKIVKPLADEVTTDTMGNVIAFKKGKSNKKLMIPAHMDEIGFIVKHIDKEGFIRVNTIGGFDPKTLTAQRVVIHGKKDVMGVFGSKPIHIMNVEERRKPLEISNFYIETGYPGKEVKKMIEIGNAVTRYQPLIEMGDCVNCKSLDNRISVYILIEMLKNLEQPAYDTYAVFTTQEEVGVRGAFLAAHKINPDFCINLDTTIAFDSPGAKPEESITELGNGVGIKLMDSSVICDYRMVAFIKSTAAKYNIKWQPEILDKGGTDTAAVQRIAIDGALCGGLSIPTRNIHQSVEMVHKEDTINAVKLLLACVNDINQHNWAHV